jgi:hypothetical protein
MSFREIAPGKRVPFVWYNMIEPVKKLVLRIEGKEKRLCIDRIFTKSFSTGSDTVILQL